MTTEAKDPSFQSLPTDETLRKVAQLKVYDSRGNQVPFGSLFKDQKTVVVFIRCVFLLPVTGGSLLRVQPCAVSYGIKLQF